MPDSYTYRQVAATQGGTGTQVTTGPCLLHSVVINSKGASSNLLTLYDTVGGTATCSTIAIIDTTASVGTLLYDIAVTRGLLAYSNAGTGANYTVTFA